MDFSDKIFTVARLLLQQNEKKSVYMLIGLPGVNDAKNNVQGGHFFSPAQSDYCSAKRPLNHPLFSVKKTTGQSRTFAWRRMFFLFYNGGQSK